MDVNRLEDAKGAYIGNTLRGKTVFTRSAITQPKVNRFLDEIWSTLSTLLGAGPGRLWARSVQ